MTEHIITLSESMAAFIDERLADGGYAPLRAYVSELVAPDIARRNTAIVELRDLLEEAESSEVSTRSLDEILDYARYPQRKPASSLRSKFASLAGPMPTSCQ